MTPTAIVAYLTLFATVGVLFLFVTLLLGRFLRPCAPSSAKLEIYECGEPPIGTSFVQYDLRFYVVALLFIVFEVELAFFFPPAVVFGKLTQAMSLSSSSAAPTIEVAENAEGKDVNGEMVELYQQLGIDNLFLFSPHPGLHLEETQRQVLESRTRTLALAAIIDLGVFFAVLLVGFAYLWKRGDLEWVRAVGGSREG